MLSKKKKKGAGKEEVGTFRVFQSNDYMCLEPCSPGNSWTSACRWGTMNELLILLFLHAQLLLTYWTVLNLTHKFSCFYPSHSLPHPTSRTWVAGWCWAAYQSKPTALSSDLQRLVKRTAKQWLLQQKRKLIKKSCFFFKTTFDISIHKNYGAWSFWDTFLL